MGNSINHLDNIDQTILTLMQQDSSISNVRLADHIGLSPAATLSRVKKLEQEGYIEKYTAVVNKEKLGYDLLCIVQVSMENHEVGLVTQFREEIQKMPEVLECFFLTGQSDYLLKVAVKNRQALEHFLLHRLTPAPGVSRLQTSIVLSEVKSGSLLKPL